MSVLPPRDIKRLLLVRNDRIGDLVLTLPLFEAARRALPEAHITALVNPSVAPLLRRNAHLDDILLDDPGAGGWALGKRLGPARFDAVLVVNTNTRNCTAVWRAGIPIRVCWAHKPAGFVLGTHRVWLHRSHPPVHEAEFALAFLRCLGIDGKLSECSPRLFVDPAVRDRVAGRLRADLGSDGPLFGINPGCGGSSFNWPWKRYAEFAEGLAAHGRVVVTGGPGEEAILDSMRALLSDRARRCVALYPDLDLTELAAAILEMNVMTASSTGPMHMAGVLGTPVVALFSPHPVQGPLKWAPFGERNVILVAPLEEGEDPAVPPSRGEELMERISVDEVIEACLSRLSAPACACCRPHADRQRQPCAACHGASGAH